MAEVIERIRAYTARPYNNQQPLGDKGDDSNRTDEKVELMEGDAYEILGYSYPTWKKWLILSVMFYIQISINLNASLYANGVPTIATKFKTSEQTARVPQLTFLVAYAFGCELWAPWSEELGRWGVQQASLFLVNLWQIPCAFAPNFATLVVCRLLGGLSTAGGSVTLGVLADMWEPADQEYAIAFIVLSSVGGSVVGAVIGGFIEQYLALKWIFWVQLIAGGVAQILHFLIVPETRATILLNREAKKRRRAGDHNIYGPNEIHGYSLGPKYIIKVWLRPFYMLFTEPIVAWLSLLSGFSDALIFTFLQGFSPIYEQYGFKIYQIGLAFIPLLIGYFLAYLSFLPSIHYFRNKRRRFGEESVEPEARLWWLLYVIPCLPIGLFGFAWTSLGPRYVPWIAPMIFTTLVGIGNYSIYQSSIDYTVAAYGPYAASATGGNDFARDFLSGIAALYSTPMFSNIGKTYPEEWASTILAILAVFITSPVYYFYKKGPQIRLNSKFAQQVAEDRKRQLQRRRDSRAGGAAKGEKETFADEETGNPKHEEEAREEHELGPRHDEPHHPAL